MQLAEWQAKFAALGVKVAAMSYDEVPVLAEFSADNGIAYPLLADGGGQYMAALGIRNEEYEAGHFAHGVPHPGVLFVDASGRVRLKRAVPGYRDRPSLPELLAAVAALAPAEPEAGEGASNKGASEAE